MLSNKFEEKSKKPCKRGFLRFFPKTFFDNVVS